MATRGARVFEHAAHLHLDLGKPVSRHNRATMLVSLAELIKTQREAEPVTGELEVEFRIGREDPYLSQSVEFEPFVPLCEACGICVSRERDRMADASHGRDGADTRSR
jgi:hypothetical protein